MAKQGEQQQQQRKLQTRKLASSEAMAESNRHHSTASMTAKATGQTATAHPMTMKAEAADVAYADESLTALASTMMAVTHRQPKPVLMHRQPHRDPPTHTACCSCDHSAIGQCCEGGAHVQRWAASRQSGWTRAARLARDGCRLAVR